MFKYFLEVNSYLMHLLLNDFIYFDDYYDSTKTKPEVLEDSLFKGLEKVYYTPLLTKVIIRKSRGEVSLVEQDTFENVCKLIKNSSSKKISALFMQLFSADATIFLISGQKRAGLQISLMIHKV